MKTGMSGKNIKTMITPHGTLEAPFFMPDATRGFVKFTDGEELKRAGIKALVVNTFHLYLQPGLKIIEKAGGIHEFMNWSGPILSDSGGFQVFSLIHKNPAMGKIFDDHVEFKSPLDGSKHELTPEKAIQIQFSLGVDMMVCLDDCPPNEFNQEELKKSVNRTIAWAKRCRLEFDKQVKKRKLDDSSRPKIFGVIQGGADLGLRKYCADELIKIGFDGYGFGARHVDQEGKFLDKVLEFTAKAIPDEAFKFGLGIGMPEDIVRAYKMGWDMFDCVIPTREGRHGKLFCWKRMTNDQIPISKKITGQNFYKAINITNSKFAKDFSPISENSKLEELRGHSKAYLHHLFKLNDPLGARLASLNNLEFYADLMEDIKIK